MCSTFSCAYWASIFHLLGEISVQNIFPLLFGHLSLLLCFKSSLFCMQILYMNVIHIFSPILWLASSLSHQCLLMTGFGNFDEIPFFMVVFFIQSKKPLLPPTAKMTSGVFLCKLYVLTYSLINFCLW